MITKLGVVTILVRDQDEALKYYTEQLGLVKKDDMAWAGADRWLTVTPKDQPEMEIFLAKADSFGMDLMEHVGKTPAWSFSSNNVQKTYEELSARGVKFSGPPKVQPYGTEAKFEDLYGNQFVIVEKQGE